MRFDQLFESTADRPQFPLLHVNSFGCADVLLGAQVLEVRFDGIRSVLGLLLEMRLTDHEWQGSSGLIVASDVKDFSWSQDSRVGQRTAWTILGSVPQIDLNGLTLRLVGSPTFSLDCTASKMSCYSGSIDKLDEVPPPDYTDADMREIRSAIPQWGTPVGDVKAAHFP